MSSIQIRSLRIPFRKYSNNSPTIKDLIVNPKLFLKEPDLFYAVNGVSLNINEGERVGIIGRNGSGKSTLLKAICSIYEEYEGKIKISGRIAPLLEVGAGFVPELTGLDNLYLNAGILGMSKMETKLIEEEIISFSGLSNYMNMPIKLYSTGMYMRLAFSIASAVKPDILIVDEIFAGGDFAFIKKARKRMSLLFKASKILLMVSHDMNLIKKFCNRVIVIDKGIIKYDGTPSDAIKYYLAH